MIPDCKNAGPLLMVDLPGPELDSDTAEHLRRHQVGTVCLFRKNVESERQLAKLTSDLRAVLGEHALIAIDQEGGGVVRTPFLPFPPSAMCLGATDDPELAYQVGAATARPLAALGINWNFAPVLDLNVNPQNPVIGDRAFGADPVRAADLALAWLAGSLAEGVAGCVKHFPGHGDTALDSHLALPRVDKPRAALEAGEFAPFERAVKAGAPAVMTAHIVYSALDRLPATLSKNILTDLLREAWGYSGVVVTDSMGMQAIDAHWGRGEAAVLALAAGADLVMALGRREAQEETLRAVEAALKSGRVSVEGPLGRLEGLAARFPSRPGEYTGRARDEGLMREAWARGMTLYREPRFPAPGSEVTLVAAPRVPGDKVSEAGVNGEEIARALSGVYTVRPLLTARPAELDWAALRAAGHPIILASAGRHRDAALARTRPDLHLALWNPYAALDVDAPALISYGYRPEALSAVARCLAGDLKATGRLPVPFTGA